MRLKSLVDFKAFHYCLPYSVGGMEGPCPICGASDGFGIRDWDEKDGGFFICSHCGKQGDTQDLFYLLSEDVHVPGWSIPARVVKEIRCGHKGCGYVGAPKTVGVPQHKNASMILRLECPKCGTFHGWAAQHDYFRELAEALRDAKVSAADVIAACRRHSDGSDDDETDIMSDNEVAHALLLNRELLAACVEWARR